MKSIKLGSGAGGSTYTHPLGTAVAEIPTRYEHRSDGIPWLAIQRFRVNARIKRPIGGTLADLDNLIRALEDALLTDYDQAAILHEDGSTSAHLLGGARLRGGVRPVTGVSYLKYSAGELVTYRNCSYEIEGVFALFNGDETIIDQQEEVSYTESGKTYGVLQPNIGTATIQQTRDNQHSVCVQSGSITHAGKYGPIPDALYSSGQLGPPKIRKRSPRKIGTGGRAAYVGFTQSYEYGFAATADLTSNPTAWS